MGTIRQVNLIIGTLSARRRMRRRYVGSAVGRPARGNGGRSQRGCEGAVVGVVSTGAGSSTPVVTVHSSVVVLPPEARSGRDAVPSHRTCAGDALPRRAAASVQIGGSRSADSGGPVTTRRVAAVRNGGLVC